MRLLNMSLVTTEMALNNSFLAPYDRDDQSTRCHMRHQGPKWGTSRQVGLMPNNGERFTIFEEHDRELTWQVVHRFLWNQTCF